MRSMRKYRGRSCAVSTDNVEYVGVVASVSREGVELSDAKAVVNGLPTPLSPVVFVPLARIVHVQVVGS